MRLPWLVLLPLCLSAMAPVVAETVLVPAPSPYSYESETVRPLQVRGRDDRYLIFQGRTVISWPATPARFDAGSPGSLRCQGSTCHREGYVPPSFTAGTPAGSESRSFIYELDCLDLTFNRRGDRLRGWVPLGEDPTAWAVAKAYCPGISRSSP